MNALKMIAQAEEVGETCAVRGLGIKPFAQAVRCSPRAHSSKRRFPHTFKDRRIGGVRLSGARLLRRDCPRRYGENREEKNRDVISRQQPYLLRSSGESRLKANYQRSL